jgi:hypothetical protein
MFYEWLPWALAITRSQPKEEQQFVQLSTLSKELSQQPVLTPKPLATPEWSLQGSSLLLLVCPSGDRELNKNPRDCSRGFLLAI